MGTQQEKKGKNREDNFKNIPKADSLRHKIASDKICLEK
jgi:hypothetical protein